MILSLVFLIPKNAGDKRDPVLKDPTTRNDSHLHVSAIRFSKTCGQKSFICLGKLTSGALKKILPLRRCVMESLNRMQFLSFPSTYLLNFLQGFMTVNKQLVNNPWYKNFKGQLFIERMKERTNE